MTQITGEDKNLLFQIISARINEPEKDKKYVVYNLLVRHISANNDNFPSVIERRYSQFLCLYNSLKSECPELMYSTDFPKKVLMGNFDNNLITTRSTCFENFLKYVVSHDKLRNSKSLINFVQEPELTQVKELIKVGQYERAYKDLELIFSLLNKVFTDRSPPVLLCLCRILGCGFSAGTVNYRKWAEVALHRYEGVSDIDLLSLYVPVLKICVENGLKKEELEKRLLDLSKTGFVVNKKDSLLTAVDSLEKKLSDLNY